MRKLIAMVLTCGITLFLISGVGASDSDTTSSNNWVAPKNKAIARVSAISGAQREPTFLNNFDCWPSTFRFVASSDMRTGCFTSTAFGLMDADSGAVIFNGTDEALPLKPYSAHQIIVPWANAGNVLTLDALSTGGSLVTMYRSPLAHLQDERNLSGQLVAKQLTAPPDLPLYDSGGQRLVVNTQTLAVSDGGSWLVAETLSGTFVRINLATLETIAFAPAFGSQGSPALLKSKVAISENGNFVAVENDAADSFKIYDLSACHGASICPSYNYQSFIRANIPTLSNIRHVRFINNNLVSFEVTATQTELSGTYEIAPVDAIESFTDYVGLGDSYTSGEGAFNYISGTDTSINSCHLSTNSYPILISKDIFSAGGGHSVACSGATLSDISSTSETYRGQIREAQSLAQLKSSTNNLLETVETNFVPGYIAQNRFVSRWQPRIISVSIGGNDVGFGSMLQECVLPHVSVHLSDSTCFNTYEDRQEVMNLVERTVPRWANLFNQLQNDAPHSTIYTVGYPSIIDDTGKCALNVHLNKSELEFAAELLVYINRGIAQASNEAGVQYVDISKALVGHRLCETASHNVAVNGLTAGRDRGVFGKESYHPNALGHQLIEQAILKQTNNFRSKLAQGTLPEKPTNTAPRSGKGVRLRIPMVITSSLLKKGTVISVEVGNNTLKPNSTYSIYVGESQPISSVQSDSSGNINAIVNIPNSSNSGATTIDVTGTNNADEPIIITQPVFIPQTDLDADGDGFNDSIDSCPYAVNAQLDTDNDNIDDVCDPVIDLPHNGSVNGTASTETSKVEKQLVTTPLVVARFSNPNRKIAAVKSNIRNSNLNYLTLSLRNSGARQYKKNEGTSRGIESQPLLNFKNQNPEVIWWYWLFIIPVAFYIIIYTLEKIFKY